VGGFLSGLWNALFGHAAAPAEVRAALLELQKSRAKLELEPLAGGGEKPLVMTTKVEQVRESCFIVSRPIAGGAMQSLGRYEHYRMRFDTPDGRTVALTQATVRVRIPSSGGAVLYGHKMVLPASLQLEKPLRPVSALMGDDHVREAQLIVLGRSGPILGLVQDLDASGARLHCRNADENLRPGQQGYLKLSLPDSVGDLEEPVKVTGIEPSRRPGEVTVRVAFRDKNDRIDEILRAFHAERRARRAG
jgi:hypothetical protein